jgi:hypothetical protein
MATYVDLATLHAPVPRSKPPATWGAQIRENDEYLWTNRREICTSGTRPGAYEGLELYETDTNLTYVYDGSSYVQGMSFAADATYTPTWTQGATITKTTTLSVYRKVARRYSGHVVLTASSSGTVSTAIKVTTPATSTFSSNAVVGSGYFYNTSVNIPLIVYLDSTTTFSFLPAFSPAAGAFGTATLYYATGTAPTNGSIVPTVGSGMAISFSYAIHAAT